MESSSACRRILLILAWALNVVYGVSWLCSAAKAKSNLDDYREHASRRSNGQHHLPTSSSSSVALYKLPARLDILTFSPWRRR